MKNSLFILICTLLVSCFSACRPKPIDIKVSPAPVKLSISSSVIPNRFVFVAVTKSFSSLDNQNGSDSISEDLVNKILVKNALVIIRYADKIDTLVRLADGLFGSTKTLLSNYTTYDLSVKDLDTQLEITANTYMLPYYSFDSIRPYKIIEGKDTLCKLHIELKDDLNNENYYVINYIKKENKGGLSALNVDQFFSKGSGSYQNYFDLLNDASFNNGRYITEKELENINPKDSLVVTVSNISKGYYEFLSTYKRAGSLINTLTGEPINYPSNVKNGYGYFNAYYPQILFFDMKNY